MIIEDCARMHTMMASHQESSYAVFISSVAILPTERDSEREKGNTPSCIGPTVTAAVVPAAAACMHLMHVYSSGVALSFVSCMRRLVSVKTARRSDSS